MNRASIPSLQGGHPPSTLKYSLTQNLSKPCHSELFFMEVLIGGHDLLNPWPLVIEPNLQPSPIPKGQGLELKTLNSPIMLSLLVTIPHPEAI